jgi:hypothetical protein
MIMTKVEQYADNKTDATAGVFFYEEDTNGITLG